MIVATPLGVLYYTPLMDNLDCVFPDIAAQPLFGDCVSANTSLFGNSDDLQLARIRTYDSTVQQTTTYKVVLDFGWPCHDSGTPRPLQHRHQLGWTSITYRGNCSSKETPEHMLWRAKNMAASLSSILVNPDVVPTEAVRGSSAHSAAPRFGTATTQVNQRIVDHLAHLMQQHQLYRSMLRLNLRDCKSWMQPWQPMTVPEKANACSLANEMLGDLSLPYPDMSIASVVVIFERSNST